MRGFVIGISVDDLIRIAVPTMVGTLLPESGAVEIRLGDAKEGESGDAEGKLDDEECYKDSRRPPLPWD